jgi:hypothetical protein
MLQYKIASVAADADKAKHVVYVKIFDDKSPDIILSNLCIPFESQESFETELQKRTTKYIESVSAVDAVRVLAEQSIAKTAAKISEVTK